MLVVDFEAAIAHAVTVRADAIVERPGGAMRPSSAADPLRCLHEVNAAGAVSQPTGEHGAEMSPSGFASTQQEAACRLAHRLL